MKKWMKSQLVRRIGWSLIVTFLAGTLDLMSWNIFFVKTIADLRGRPPANKDLAYVILDDPEASTGDVIRFLEPYGTQTISIYSQPKRPNHLMYRWPEGGYEVLTSTSLLHHEIDAQMLKNRMIVLGDRPQVETLEESAAVIQRRMREWDANLRDLKMPVLQPWLLWIVLFAVSLLCVWIVLDSRIGTSLATFITMVFGLLAIGTSLFGTLWIPVGTIIFEILLAFYVTMPLRVLVESTRRWKLEKQTTVQQRIEEMKTNFLSLVTHDLKTPVAKILGWAQHVKQSPRLENAAEEKASLDHIERSAEDLNRFIGSLLELSKLESEKLLIHPQSRDINRLVELVVRECEPLATRKGIQIITALEPLFPIYVDEHLFSKVIRNLIDNAIKYSPAQSRIDIATIEINDHVQISVKDQGPGLSAEESESIFHRFYRANNEATRSVSGSGLGLYLSRFFIQAMGGTIGVNSHPGKGSNFRITLPSQSPYALSQQTQEYSDVENSGRR